MRKLSIFLTLVLIFTFTSGQIVSASGLEPSKEEMYKALDGAIKDLENSLEDVLTGLDEENLEDNIARSISHNELLARDYKNEIEKSPSVITRLVEKYLKITRTIEEQYRLKSTFISNTKEAKELVIDLKSEIKSIGNNLEFIFNNPDINLPYEDFYTILKELKALNLDLKNSPYAYGSLARESTKYIKQVVNLEVYKAADTFRNIVDLQYSQLDLLNTSKNRIDNISNLLNYI